ECGSHLYATSVGDGPKVYGVRTGTARQRDQLVPRTQYWHRSALHWLPEFEGTRVVEEQ
ncbi:GFA family protein, partial [Mesorhizobium sp. M3A.F.Ca.ET.201.01.1.1]